MRGKGASTVASNKLTNVGADVNSSKRRLFNCGGYTTLQLSRGEFKSHKLHGIVCEEQLLPSALFQETRHRYNKTQDGIDTANSIGN